MRNEFKPGIYTITSPTGKIYVGQTHRLIHRKSAYKKGYTKGQPKIHRSLNKHGWEAHKFEVVIEFKKDISQGWLDYWECFFIKYFKENGFELLNIRDGGSRGLYSGIKGRPRNRTYKRGEDHPNYGKTLSKEAKKSIGDVNRGRIFSEESRNRMSASSKSYLRKGVPLSEEHKRKVSEGNMGRKAHNKGVKMSEEQRAKLKIAFIGRKPSRLGVKLSDECKNKQSIKMKAKIDFGYKDCNTVLNTENGIFYPTMKAAYEASGMEYEKSYFRKMIKGHHKNKTPFIIV